jgi:transketolase
MKNLQETIRKVLREETKKDKLVDNYITSLIRPDGNFKEGYNHESQRLDVTDTNDNLIATIFYNKRRDAMDVMIDESIWMSLSEMFSMETWDEVNDSLVRWFRDNYDGLEEIYEVNTFDNAEYDY